MHSGIAVVGAHVVIEHPGEPTLVFYDGEGMLKRTVELDGYFG